MSISKSIATEPLESERKGYGENRSPLCYGNFNVNEAATVSFAKTPLLSVSCRMESTHIWPNEMLPALFHISNDYGWKVEDTHSCCPLIQTSAKRQSPGLVNSIPAVTYYFCLDCCNHTTWRPPFSRALYWILARHGGQQFGNCWPILEHRTCR